MSLHPHSTKILDSTATVLVRMRTSSWRLVGACGSSGLILGLIGWLLFFVVGVTAQSRPAQTWIGQFCLVVWLLCASGVFAFYSRRVQRTRLAFLVGALLGPFTVAGFFLGWMIHSPLDFISTPGIPKVFRTLAIVGLSASIVGGPIVGLVNVLFCKCIRRLLWRVEEQTGSLCWHCGYDLQGGSARSGCPECGYVVRPSSSIAVVRRVIVLDIIGTLAIVTVLRMTIAVVQTREIHGCLTRIGDPLVFPTFYALDQMGRPIPLAPSAAVWFPVDEDGSELVVGVLYIGGGDYDANRMQLQLLMLRDGVPQLTDPLFVVDVPQDAIMEVLDDGVPSQIVHAMSKHAAIGWGSNGPTPTAKLPQSVIVIDWLSD